VRACVVVMHVTISSLHHGTDSSSKSTQRRWRHSSRVSIGDLPIMSRMQADGGVECQTPASPNVCRRICASSSWVRGFCAREQGDHAGPQPCSAKGRGTGCTALAAAGPGCSTVQVNNPACGCAVTHHPPTLKRCWCPEPPACMHCLIIKRLKSRRTYLS
jgi:hypothetical protein